MTSQQEFLQRLERFASGVKGLDRVLGGGFFKGGVYILEGPPGAGKTIFANQVCFHQVREGARVLYVTLLAESHSRLLQHLQGLTFFDASAIPDRLTYVSGFRSLEDGGLQELLDLVRKEVRGQGATLCVLDGFAAVGETADSDRQFKKFVYELQVNAGLSGCTFFLLSSGITADYPQIQPVHTMVDGLVRLTDHVFGSRSQRELRVQKFRGSGYLRGVHSFDISDDGIAVHARLESFSADLVDTAGSDRLTTGVPGLDVVVGGGLPHGSTTMVLGPTGVGKTLLGYRFVSACGPTEKAVLLSFYETPKRALAKAEAVGVDLKSRCEHGQIELDWLSPVENSLDAIGGRILGAIDRTGAARLFIDGFDAFLHATAYPERVTQFFAALGRELHARGVTTMHSAELRAIFAPAIEAPVRGLSPLLENLLLLRFVEHAARVRRALSVLKMRDSDFDTAVHELVIDARGIRVVDGFDNLAGVLTGVAKRETPPPRPPAAARRTKDPKKATGAAKKKAKRKTSPGRRR
jgi:circadian clock protein KaiC